MENKIKTLQTVKIASGVLFIASIIGGLIYSFLSPECLGVSGERLGCGMSSMINGARIAFIGVIIAIVSSRLANRELLIMRGERIIPASPTKRFLRVVVAIISAFFLWYVLLLLTNGNYSDFIGVIVLIADTIFSILITLLLFC